MTPKEKEQKLLPRFAQSYWDIKFQMQRQSDKIRNTYSRLNTYVASWNKYSKK